MEGKLKMEISRRPNLLYFDGFEIIIGLDLSFHLLKTKLLKRSCSGKEKLGVPVNYYIQVLKGLYV